MSSAKPSTKPLYQKLIMWIGYLLFGFLAAGSLLDSISNSIALISPRVTHIASAVIIVSWVFVEFTIAMFRVPWIGIHSTRFRLLHLGPQTRLAIIGILALLWVPRLGDLPYAGEVPSVVIKVVNNSDSEIVVDRRGDFVIWFPNASFDGAPRVPGRFILQEMNKDNDSNEPIRVKAKSEQWVSAKILNANYFASILDRDDTDITVFVRAQPGDFFRSLSMPFARDVLSRSYIEWVIPNQESAKPAGTPESGQPPVR